MDRSNRSTMPRGSNAETSRFTSINRSSCSTLYVQAYYHSVIHPGDYSGVTPDSGLRLRTRRDTSPSASLSSRRFYSDPFADPRPFPSLLLPLLLSKMSPMLLLLLLLLPLLCPSAIGDLAFIPVPD